jgi:hypothetical protein
MDIADLGVNLLIGGLGGIAWNLVASLGWNEHYEWVRRVVLGLIVGLFLFFIGVSGLNGGEEAFTVIAAAYLAVDWFTALELRRGG